MNRRKPKNAGIDMKITFFKLPQHRVFNHIPIYYDEVKDAQKEREARIKEELGLNEKDSQSDHSMIESRIRGKMKQRHEPMFNVVRKEKAKSNRRILLIVLVLLAIAYYLLKSSTEWIELVSK